MFYARIKRNGIEEGFLLDFWDTYYRLTFFPYTEVLGLIEFTTNGKTYADRKESVRKIAQEMQVNEVPGLTWSDVLRIANWFEVNGKRYGLLNEFKENGII